MRSRVISLGGWFTTRTQTCDLGISFFPVTNRLFSAIGVWGRVEFADGAPVQLVIAHGPRDVPESEFEGFKERHGNLVKGKAQQVFVIERISPNISKVTFATNPDVGGKIPSSIGNTLITTNLNVVNDVYDVFERRGKDVDEEVRFGSVLDRSGLVCRSNHSKTLIRAYLTYP